MFERRQVEKDAGRLAVVLGRELGESRVIDDPEILDAVSGDKSHCDAVLPHLLVRARHEADIRKVLSLATEYRVPVTPRGAGTGKSGGAIPVCGGLVLDTSKMTRVLEVDRSNLLAVVEPGVITGVFQQQLEAEGLFYPPDPNSLETCTIGGNVAHNAGGPRAFKYGVTREYVMGTRTVLPNGEVVATGRRTVKGVAGYDMNGLMVGSEGTLGVFSTLTLRLTHRPSQITTLLVDMPTEIRAGAAVAAIVASGLVPRVLEFMDSSVVSILRQQGIGGVTAQTGALLLVEMDGPSEDVVEQDVLALAECCEKAGATEISVAQGASQRERLWAARRLMSDALAATARFKASEDIVVPRTEAERLLSGIRQLSDRFGVRMAAYGHAGDGNYHINILWDDEAFEPEPAVAAVFDLTLSLRGTITGEHGVGISKKPYLPKEQSSCLIELQRSVKAAIDPAGILNPGKIF